MSMFTIFLALCVCALGPPLLTIAGSAIAGLILALADLWRTLLEEHHGAAHRVYVVDRGWRVLRVVIIRQFARAGQSAELWRDHVQTMHYLAFTRLGPLKYPAQLVIVALRIATRVHYLLAVVIVVIFVSISIPILLALVIVTFSGLALLASVDLLASLFGQINGFACYCPCCYLRTYSPLFLCSSCKTVRPHLRPCIHGVLAHRCAHCHKRLPTLNLLGRKSLERICPRCQSPIPLAAGTTITTHIALIGGIGAGKTACLVANLRSLLATRSCRANFIVQEQQQSFEHALKQLGKGEALATTSDPKPRAIMLLLRSPRQLLYLYDPAGKDFTTSGRAYQHTYYQHSDGLLFIIDPFAITAFYRRHQEEIAQCLPGQRLAEPEIGRLYERMMSAFEVCAGLHPGQPYRQSVAVVVSKADQPPLENEIGESAMRAFVQQQADACSETEAEHLLVRQFLCRYDLENMVRDLEMHFSHVRYFSCSIHCSAATDDGGATGAQAALAWLLKSARR